MSRLRRSVERQWYSEPTWLLLLAPLVMVFAGLSRLRRFWLSRRAAKVQVPVVVVGNISVGGTGKTPVIIALVKALSASGWTPGVIARGYGAKVGDSKILPEQAEPAHYGDEPVLVQRATGCSVAVGRNRIESAALLIEYSGCNIILSDDGLQHYRLQRDVELAVVDGVRQLGNGWRLPVGPLRESKHRLLDVDYVLINGEQPVPAAPAERTYHLHLQPVAWCNVLSGETLAIGALNLSGACAIAGIGNPQRFFDTLRTMGFDGQSRAFADHHVFSADDFSSLPKPLVLMTEKDAVKCRPFASENWWALSVEAQLPDEFLARLLESLKL